MWTSHLPLPTELVEFANCNYIVQKINVLYPVVELRSLQHHTFHYTSDQEPPLVLTSLLRAVATGTVGPVSAGPLSPGALSHVFTVKRHVTVHLMASRTTFKALLPSLPDKPHQLKDFAFPKQTFGKSKTVLCSARSQWFSTWLFLHYDEGRDVVFCHTCVTPRHASQFCECVSLEREASMQ